MNDSEVSQHVAQWIENTLSKPSPHFNHLPPCPYSHSSLLKGKVDVRYEPTGNLLQALAEIAEAWDDSFEVMMVMCDPQAISPSELADGAIRLSDRFKSRDLLVNFDHPSCTDPQHKVTSTNGKYAMGAVQRLGNFVEAAAPLFRKGYYGNVSYEDLSQFTSFKGRFADTEEWLSAVPNVRPYDLRPEATCLMKELVEHLSQRPKSLPSKINYRREGAELYEKVCETPEYYLTRTELSIMSRFIEEISSSFDEDTLMIEYGSGNSRKTRLLFEHLPNLVAYMPIDFAKDQLFHTAAEIAQERPGLEILPVCADYTLPFELPSPSRPFSRRLFFYPGSTIGNQEPQEAALFLEKIRRQCAPGDALLIGVDLQKHPQTLRDAYDDPQGANRDFILNPLIALKRDFGIDFDLSSFRHRVRVDERGTCVGIFMESLCDQTLRIGDIDIEFQRGELVRRAVSYKYSHHAFQALVEHAGWAVERVWTDDSQWFAVQHLVAV